MTLDEVITALTTNADFEEVGSVAKAKAFVTAAKRWLILAPASASKEGSSLSMNPQQVENLLKRAQDYVVANDTAGNRRPGARYLAAGARS